MPDATVLTVDARSGPPPTSSPNGHRGRGSRRAPSTLPSGRALLGGLLITLAAVGTYVAVRGDSGVPSTQYVVVARDIDVGEHVTAADLAVEPIELPTSVTAQAFPSAGAIEGAVALTPLRAGGLLQRGQILLPADGEPPTGPTHELSLRVPRERAVGGTLNRGERVDVLATYGNGADATTLVVARDAVVTSIDNEESATLGDDGGITLSLLLADDATVLRATHAKDVAQLTLVRATRDGDPDASNPAPERYTGPEPTPATGSNDGTGLAEPVTPADPTGETPPPGEAP